MSETVRVNVVQQNAGFGSLFVGGLFLYWFVSTHLWVLLLAAGLIVAWFVARAVERNEKHKAELAARADVERQFYAEDDPRGTYGQFLPPEGLR